MFTITEDMFKTGRPVSQGEVNFWMTKYAPPELLAAVGELNNFQLLKLEHGKLIVGHSETGHHHVLQPVRPTAKIETVVKCLVDAANDTFMKLEAMEAFKVVHLRENHTHGGFILPPGEYIRGLRKEQHQIEGWRRVAD